MYRVTVYAQLITEEWIHTSTSEMKLEVARAVMDRISERLHQHLKNKWILDYEVVVEIAE